MLVTCLTSLEFCYAPFASATETLSYLQILIVYDRLIDDHPLYSLALGVSRSNP